jgi:hypothetical protein
MTANVIFPGRPDYTGPTSGWFGAVHHDTLCEESHDINERLAYIDRNKPSHEIPIRRWNMIYLGDCPAVAARKALGDQYYAAIKALRDQYYAAWDALDAEILAYIRTHIPDFPWDGKELVMK